MSRYILVVDDQFGVRLLIHKVLEEAGYSVISVASGSECLNHAISLNRPSLILLDYRMPVMTGLQVLSKLSQDDQAKQIPVIMISAESDVEDAARCYGVQKFLSKPLDMNILLKTVEETFLNISLT
ncbi:response regulator with CheY-like receiver, AAA-type ATPase, and DNA-binding domains [Desulfosporosinus orientis DSM 765]|uniref:Stage 0 sporulation protein A homolog n=1 Tax=Desulfosporosinus orientis (strain ATCC 19365 / DSM 765 / NCIMB 8382 / VKM B-1628 / Singapore I) TaxID=768706 RepID=G7WFU1_DESOD|nr:response regulator [Desulfosporosinus orientis]AET69456.1 response regulator with CheY-like receiver, AAA-type ATPase, and DNA-binding domains [Desulfosporosinus orientis DSM 765]